MEPSQEFDKATFITTSARVLQVGVASSAISTAYSAVPILFEHTSLVEDCRLPYDN